MADLYVWSGATGAANGSSWANAYTTLIAAHAGASGGSKIWVAHDHNEVSTTTFALNLTKNLAFVCVDRGGSVPPSLPTDLRTTASVAYNPTSTNTMTITATTAAAFSSMYGINFKAGNSSVVANMAVNNTTGIEGVFTKCTFQLLTTAASAVMTWGAGATYNCLYDCQVKFSNIGQKISGLGRVRWIGGGLMSGSSVPTGLIATATAVWLMEGVDLSALNTHLFGGTTTNVMSAVVKDCKLHSSVTIIDSGYDADVSVINGAKLDRYYRYGNTQNGFFTYRNGGASFDGVPFSTVISVAGVNPVAAQLPPINAWNVDTGTKTLTVECGAYSAIPNNAELYMDVSYIGVGGQAEVVSTRRPSFAEAPTTYPASSAVWTNPVSFLFSMSVSFDADISGPVTVTIFSLKPVTNFIFCPKPDII